MSLFTRAFVVVSFVLVACSPSPDTSTTTVSPTPPTGGSCGTAGRSGDSDCSLHNTTCHAGTYCNSVAGTYTYCLDGCASDANCGENEHCLKCDPSSSFGSCQSCSVASCQSRASSCKTVANSTSCPAPGSVYACSDPRDAPGPEAGSCTALPIGASPTEGEAYCCGVAVNACMRNNVDDQPACHGSGKAYICAPNQEAPATCTSSPIPGVYCCP